MPYDLQTAMAGLNATAAMSGPSQTALALRARTKQRAALSRQQRTSMIEEIMSSGLLAGGMAAGGGGGGGQRSAGGGGMGGVRNGPGKGLVTITTPNGGRVTVAANYASRFKGLLGDLWNAGYKFKSVGGYSYRNIAGTNRLSKHATGEAIDIDPQPNRGDRLGGGGPKYGYFDPRIVNAIVRKWGLDWGANWSSADPMHFSTGG